MGHSNGCIICHLFRAWILTHMLKCFCYRKHITFGIERLRPVLVAAPSFPLLAVYGLNSVIFFQQIFSHFSSKNGFIVDRSCQGWNLLILGMGSTVFVIVFNKTVRYDWINLQIFLHLVTCLYDLHSFKIFVIGLIRLHIPVPL